MLSIPIVSGLKEVSELTNPIVVSDLHLTPKKPKTIMAFLRFLKTYAPLHSELVILGDLFDFWIGDDAKKQAEPIMAQLKLFSSTGRRILVMPGNRDVLLGEDFAKDIGAELLCDPIVISVRGTPVLFSHGDEWCLLDEQYQSFRSMVRNPQWQAMFLGKTIPERLAMAQEARRTSESDKSEKTAKMMDVVESAVGKDALKYNAKIVIHGHTHKPGAHVLPQFERWVLPDWECDLTQGTGRAGYIHFTDENKPQIIML